MLTLIIILYSDDNISKVASEMLVLYIHKPHT